MSTQFESIKTVSGIRKISKRSKILPLLIPFKIPGFEKYSQTIIPEVLSISYTDSETWYQDFVRSIEVTIGKSFYPIMRLSDGEYYFLFGERFPVLSGNPWFFLKSLLSFVFRVLRNPAVFKARTLPDVSSGDYSKKEINALREKYTFWVKHISEKGVLALHLTFAPRPFQEKYHYVLKRWMNKNNIDLNNSNYYPFYFVYAAFIGQEKSRLLKGRKILVVHGATGDKKNRIIKSITNEGAQVNWLGISGSRSLYDVIDVKQFLDRIDIVLIGAGIGKANIIMQLEPLNVPCIDLGYVFEAWADNRNRSLRPYMIPDIEKISSS